MVVFFGRKLFVISRLELFPAIHYNLLTKRDFPALHSGLSFLQKDFHFYRGYAAASFLLS
jgi:hypothetical protein